MHHTRLSHKLQQYQLDTLTLDLKQAPVYRRILGFIYKLLGRKMIARLLVSSVSCGACNRCITECPNKAMRLWFRNPRRNKQCKGCLWCVYTCPKRAFELPVISLAGAFTLLWLPFDRWIIKGLSLPLGPNTKTIGYQIIAFILWGIGYAVAVFILDKVVFLLSTLPFFKKVSTFPWVKKLRIHIHPGMIFPILVPESYRDRLS